MELMSIKVDKLPRCCGDCVFMVEDAIDYNVPDPFHRFCPLLHNFGWDNRKITKKQRDIGRLSNCPLESQSESVLGD